ncbi:hypothetical protein FA15DRAFT_665370 [Coprinopsis marcescibilis]|uniref:Secreted protein n=1 Tax=Coprinopsis marcescibilis TaxID=230819 RepID=A0A5C3L6P7_COPMA|nr:hypothetical protein FA15DRAFT_665370 [Coprinopsis marcescibilis]
MLAAAFVLASQLLAAAAAALPQAREELALLAVPPPGFEITGFTSVGSGCPNPSTVQWIDDDKKGLSTIFSHMAAEIGPEVPASSNFKFCSVNLTASVPDGYAFGIINIKGSGHRAVGWETSAARRISYQWFDSPTSAHGGNDWYNTNSGPFDTLTEFGAITLFSACGDRAATVNVTETIKVALFNPWDIVKDPKPEGSLILDSSYYEFAFKTC